ncbi:unnamed protein product, partial [Allacma fusca]
SERTRCISSIGFRTILTLRALSINALKSSLNSSRCSQPSWIDVEGLYFLSGTRILYLGIMLSHR